jgi:hypothetical protein
MYCSVLYCIYFILFYFILSVDYFGVGEGFIYSKKKFKRVK